ncbi:hypothetical protein [Mycolicibacter arupensis]|jgi:hypothetical protein|uniref:hypothetical protein n=1 Tax=Mycolicibacter arupensis TaxID=342002 RepID=UPI0023F1B2AA|nr:hypothetical protein [Mycolicibacter arupensis]
MTENEFVALLDLLVARDKWLTDHAVPIYQRAAASVGRSVKDPAVREAFTPWIASATAVATRAAEGEDITDAEVITLGVHAAAVAHRLAQAGAVAEAQPEVAPTVNPQSDGGTETETTALGSDQDSALAQAQARVEAARAALAKAQAEAFTAEMALAEIEAHTVPVQPEIVVNAGAQVHAQAEKEADGGHGDVQVEAEIEADAPSTAQANAGAKAVDSRPRIHATRRVRHSVPKRLDTRPRIRRAETAVA